MGEENNNTQIDPTQQQQTQTDSTPVSYAGKYNSEDDFAKGIYEAIKASGQNPEDVYKQFEQGIHNPHKQQQSQQQQQQQAQPLQIPDKPETPDFSKYEEELMTSGALSEQSYQELETKGYPKQLVDYYIGGLQAEAQLKTQEVFNVVGGEQSYQQIQQWAMNNMSETDIMAFNQAVNSRDVNVAKMAVKALYSDYVKANGTPPQGLVQGQAGVANSNAYSSWAQVKADMAKPEYKKDPAFREAVRTKLGNSNI